MGYTCGFDSLGYKIDGFGFLTIGAEIWGSSNYGNVDMGFWHRLVVHLLMVTGIAEAFVEQRDVQKVMVASSWIGFSESTQGYGFRWWASLLSSLSELLVTRIMCYYITGLISMGEQLNGSDTCLPGASCLHCR